MGYQGALRPVDPRLIPANELSGGEQPLECPPVATLVTGVGYIGAALVRRLQADGERVVGLDNFSSTGRAAIPSDMDVLEGDVAEPADVARAFDRLAGDEPLTVFHLAAQPSAAVALKDPATTERSNLVGARVVLEAARERGARVVFGGSFRVYGDDLAGRCVDEDTPYGRVGDLSHLSKVYVEQLGRMLGGAFCSVRLGVVYGLAPVMKSADPAYMTVPNLFCQRAVHDEPLQVIEDRALAFIHVEDAVQALLAAGALAGPVWQVVNAAPEVATIGDVARTVQDIARQRGRQVRVQGAATTAPGQRFEVRSRLPLQPRHTLREGLGEVFEAFGRA